MIVWLHYYLFDEQVIITKIRVSIPVVLMSALSLATNFLHLKWNLDVWIHVVPPFFISMLNLLQHCVNVT